MKLNPSANLKKIIAQLIQNKSLSIDCSREMIHHLIAIDKPEGNVLFSSISSLLSRKGWNFDELLGVTLGLRDTDLKLPLEDNDDIIGIVATGGERKMRTLYVTPAIALIISYFGKAILQGNRSITGCGCGKFAEADIMEKLGFPIFLEPIDAVDLLKKVNFVFLYAGKYHRLLEKYDDVRSNLGFRDIYKVAACLADPSKSKRQILGAFDRDLLDIIAQTMLALDIIHGIAFSSFDGIDEVSISAPTEIVEVINGDLKKYTMSPSDFGISPVKLHLLSGKQTLVNECQMIIDSITGRNNDNPITNFIILNSAFGLYATGRADTPKEAYEIVKNAVRKGYINDQINQFQMCGLCNDSSVSY